MFSNPQAAAVMLVAGIGIPVLAAMNANLGQRLGSPASAALVLFMVSTVTALVAVAVFGGKFTGLMAAPKHLFLAGSLIAFYVLTITWIAPTFGVGNAVFFVLLGQLISAALIDHFGLFGANVTPVTPTRFIGILVMGAGVFLTQIAGRP